MTIHRVFGFLKRLFSGVNFMPIIGQYVVTSVLLNPALVSTTLWH
ncbi:hypothetical protein [uncultured Shewanella sp.]|nr:hypothetical protein [uncultured Shewanella sp.]